MSAWFFVAVGYLILCSYLVACWCLGASPLPRSRRVNRRGGRLGRWLVFHRAIF